jgi:hypothetical protein
MILLICIMRIILLKVYHTPGVALFALAARLFGDEGDSKGLHR